MKTTHEEEIEEIEEQLVLLAETLNRLGLEKEYLPAGCSNRAIWRAVKLEQINEVHEEIIAKRARLAELASQLNLSFADLPSVQTALGLPES